MLESKGGLEGQVIGSGKGLVCNPQLSWKSLLTFQRDYWAWPEQND